MDFQRILTNPIVERAYKTAIETGIAVLATTPVADTSSLEKAAITAGATFLSVLWNGITSQAAKRKDAKLSLLQATLDAAVDAVSGSDEVETLAKMHTNGLISDAELVAKVDAAAPKVDNAP